jgi:hypothetical protein
LKTVFVCVTCGARLEGLDLQERHCTETGHSNFELHSEYEPTANDTPDNERLIAPSQASTTKVTLPKKAWLKVAEIQSHYNLKDTNRALLKAINITHEGIAKERTAARKVKSIG